MKIDSSTLRNVAGTFATGITVITLKKPDGSMHGMTANSFLSISLNPALVSFCVKTQTKTYEYLEVGQHVGISILASHQEHISSHFAGFKKSDEPIRTKKLLCGLQVIESALATYDTVVNQIIPAGDHFIILCEIRSLEKTSDEKPLIYWSGYKTISELSQT